MGPQAMAGKKKGEPSILPENREVLLAGRPALLRQVLAGLPASGCLPEHRFAGGGAARDAVARAEVRQAGAATAGHMLLFGFGDGRQVEAALRSVPNDAQATVVVLDPANLLKALAVRDLSGVLADRRLTILVGGLREIASSMPAPEERMAVLADPAALDCAAPSLVPLAKMGRELAAVQATKQTQYDGVLENIERNLDRIVQAVPAGALTPLLQGRPVMVIAPGPSLEVSLPILASCFRPFTVALDTSLRPLAAAGIVPDLAVTLDPTESNRKKFDAVSLEIPLVFFGGARPEAVGATPWPIFAWEEGGLFDGIHPGFQEGGPYRSGGSVLLAAVDLMLKAGADPLVLVGADLAMTGGKGHAAGAGDRAGAGDEGVQDAAVCKVATGSAAPHQVPGKQGGTVPASESLWRHWRRLNRRLRDERFGRVLDASAGGAKIENAYQVDLDAWLAEWGSVEGAYSDEAKEIAAAIRRLAEERVQAGKAEREVMAEAVRRALKEARTARAGGTAGSARAKGTTSATGNAGVWEASTGSGGRRS